MKTKQESDLHEQEISYINVFSLNISLAATKGLCDIMKSNLGPYGTFKMLITNSNDLKITKDGFVLLKEMQIQNPIACLIAKTISAQQYRLGDGATSTIMITSELFIQIQKYIYQGIHPQIIQQGIELGKKEIKKWLPLQSIEIKVKKSSLVSVAKSILSTKLKNKLACKIAQVLSDAILTIYRKNEEIDLEMIEIISIDNQTETESRFVKGIVLDHGSRHSKMPSILNNSFILLCNINLEYEKTDVEAEFVFSSIDKNEKLFIKEREQIEKKIKKIIQIKRFVCKDTKKGFMLINQKGIDTNALELLSREGILGIRRTKRKNMERISLMCNAIPVNLIEDITPQVLGYAGLIYEQSVGEEKYTFIENVSNPFSGTIILKGKNFFLKKQVKNAVKSTLTVLRSFIKDKCVLEGKGKIEIALHSHLLQYSELVKGKKKFGIIALAKSVLSIPKILSENSGEDLYNYFNKIDRIYEKKKLSSDTLHFEEIFDCFMIKKKIYEMVCIITSNIILIDDILLGKGLS